MLETVSYHSLCAVQVVICLIFFFFLGTNYWYVWGGSTYNMTLFSSTDDVLTPTINPYFRNLGLTHIAATSKSNFAFGISTFQ